MRQEAIRPSIHRFIHQQLQQTNIEEKRGREGAIPACHHRSAASFKARLIIEEEEAGTGQPSALLPASLPAWTPPPPVTLTKVVTGTPMAVVMDDGGWRHHHHHHLIYIRPAGPPSRLAGSD